MALLPLALAGALPLTACAALGVVYALGVRSERWADGRLLLSLLVLAVSTVLGLHGALGSPLAALQERWLILSATYLLLLLALIALNWAAGRLEEGRLDGLVLVLTLGVLNPQPLLLLALAGGAVARAAPDDRLRTPGAATQPRVWAVVGGAVLVAVAVASLLPRPTPPATVAAAERTVPVASAPQDTPPTGSGSAASRRAVRVAPAPGRTWLPPFPPELFLITGLLTVLPLAAGVWRRRFTLRRPSALDAMMVAALALNLILVFVAALTLGHGSGTGSAGSGRAAPPPATGVGSAGTPDTASAGWLGNDVLNAVMWLAFAVYLTLAVAVLAAWWRERRPTRAVPESTPDAGPTPDSPAEPLHRVRLAYREAEALLSGAGLGRAASETPGAYAQRLSGDRPELRGPLTALTRAYQPVRYGGRVTDEDAGAAEQAVRDLRATSLRPPLHPADPA